MRTPSSYEVRVQPSCRRRSVTLPTQPWPVGSPTPWTNESPTRQMRLSCVRGSATGELHGMGHRIGDHETDVDLAAERQVAGAPGPYGRVAQLDGGPCWMAVVRLADLDDDGPEHLADPPRQGDRLGQVDHRPLELVAAPVSGGHRGGQRGQLGPGPFGH